MARNVAIFLWRTLYVQAVRRHYIATAIELSAVAGLFYFLGGLREPARRLGSDSGEVEARWAFVPPRVSHIVYAPKSDYNDELMAAVLSRLLGNPARGLLSEDNATNILEPAVVTLKDADAVALKCQELVNGSDDSSTTKPLCLAFPATASDSASLSLRLYTPVEIISTIMTEYHLGTTFTPESFFDETTAFLYIIQQEHLKLKSKAFPEAEMNYTLMIDNMPGWVFAGHENSYEGFLQRALYVGFLIPLIRRMNAIQYEFTTGTAEHQGVMGLSDAEFFLGHFLTALIIGLIEIAIAIPVFLIEGKGAHGMNAGLVTVSCVIFQIGYSLLIILITWVFPKGWLAFIIAVLLMEAAPSFFSDSADSVPLPEYFLQSKTQKLLASILPHSGFYCVLRIICIARDYEEGATWSLVTRRVLGLDSITIAEIWATMLICDVVMAFLAWYLSKVLPWSTDNRQHPLFCLKPSYRKPGGAGPTEETKDKQDAYRFEELPPENKTVIAIDNLTKAYGYVRALNGVDTKVYESKITVLLGHNGAGKTTLMSILTGMQAPTSGNATVCGYDVAKQRYQVRQRVSFCQQTDIFFEDMTCTENLQYFGSLKGAPYKKLKESIQNTLRVVQLENKAQNMPNELSGGMRRRLSIALTLVSDPELLILDEPTAGMDPNTRRRIWDTLQKIATKKTLLLSSHDMEEADAIADQIIIMASGVVIGSGSTAFLKRACGVGYKLTFSKVPNAFNLADVMDIVRKTTPDALVDDDKQEQVSVALGTLDPTEFPGMFEALERSFRKLGIASMGVTVATMKDVYLKINLGWAPGGKARESAVEGKDIDAVCKPITKERTGARSFRALFAKRLLSLVRSWDLFFIFFLLPLALLALDSWRSNPQSQLLKWTSAATSADVPIKLGAHFPESVVVLGESPATNVSQRLRALVESEGCSVRSTKDVRKQLRDSIEGDLHSYITTYSMAVAFDSNVIRMIPNPTSDVTLPIVVNLVGTAWLRALTAQPTAQFNVTVTILKYSRVRAEVLVLASRFIAWYYWMRVPSLTYSLGFAAYGSFPVAERLSGARDVQLMTGIPGLEFIFAHFAFDFLYHVFFSVSWCAVHYSFSHYSAATFGLFLSVFLFFGPQAIGLGYCMAEYSVSSGAAVVWIFIALYIGGWVSTTLGFLVWIFVTKRTVHYVSLLAPPYAMLSALVKVWNEEEKQLQCKLLEKKNKVIFNKEVFGIDCSGGLLNFSYEGIGYELFVMIAEGLFFLGLMVFATSGDFCQETSFAPQEFPVDADVEEEKSRVIVACQQRDFARNSMLAWSLHKHFGALQAVRGIYVALRPSECFGLLGVNGAGKTTTFQMLAALTSVSHGDAWTATANLSEDARAWQSQISYCFQMGGLLDRLNAYEYLYLLGRLRGIPESELKPIVDGIISVVDLTEHASKESGRCSGGNRRKLSIGAALLGMQPFVFLDEPYAGVDVVSRNKIFRAIGEIKRRSRTTFVLTSHTMDECEFSCDRLTIMVGGQMMCLGTLQHLREKFGQGYRLEFLLKHTAAADAPRLDEAVRQLFAGIELDESHQNLLGYHLSERIPWSVLFTKVAQLQTNFQLEHALVGEKTLEDIFLIFAKGAARPHLPSGAPQGGGYLAPPPGPAY